MSAAGDLEADRALLREAIGAAGALALRDFRAGGRHWYKGPGQMVTETDLSVDRLLHEIVIGARSDDGWLSEERTDDGSRRERLRVWIVDPIDGTRAFVDGVPEFSISVALAIAGRAVLGMVLNPATGELFEVQDGAGAWLNGQSLQASARREPEGARLLSSRGEMRKRAWSRLMPEAEFTAIGSLAYKLALVAAGRFDGLVSLRASHDWDIAAALLLIEEAGGRISEARGAAIRLNEPDPRHDGLAAAGTASLHAALVARLASL